MKRFNGRRKPKVNNDAKDVPYVDIRDRFLTRVADGDAETLDLYVEVGRFTVDRWMAEELDRVPNEPFDEQACWHRWDQCTEKHLRDLRAEASTLLETEIKKRRILALVGDWAKRSDPMRGLFAFLSFIFWEAIRGFVGALGILAFGLILVWLEPNVAKSMRSMINDNLPVKTQPDGDPK